MEQMEARCTSPHGKSVPHSGTAAGTRNRMVHGSYSITALMDHSSGEPHCWGSSQMGYHSPTHCSRTWQLWRVWIIHGSPMAAFRRTQALSKLACKFPTDVAHKDHLPCLCKVFAMQPWYSDAESLRNHKHKLCVYLLHYFKSKWTLQNSFQWSY